MDFGSDQERLFSISKLRLQFRTSKRKLVTRKKRRGKEKGKEKKRAKPRWISKRGSPRPSQGAIKRMGKGEKKKKGEKKEGEWRLDKLDPLLLTVSINRPAQPWARRSKFLGGEGKGKKKKKKEKETNGSARPCGTRVLFLYDMER